MWDYTGGPWDGQSGPMDAWFRNIIHIPVDPSYIATAQVVLAADDDFDFYVNGTLVFSDWNEKSPFVGIAPRPYIGVPQRLGRSYEHEAGVTM